MDKTFYYRTVDDMQKRGVDPEYIQGWIGGYMGNPPREEQRLTEAYENGYRDGKQALTDNVESRVTKA